MKNIKWIIAIILMAGYSFTAYPSNLPVYELIVDFGNDWAFLHEVTFSKEKCNKRVMEIKLELKKDAKVYCMRRK